MIYAKIDDGVLVGGSSEPEEGMQGFDVLEFSHLKVVAGVIAVKSMAVILDDKTKRDGDDMKQAIDGDVDMPTIIERLEALEGTPAMRADIKQRMNAVHAKHKV